MDSQTKAVMVVDWAISHWVAILIGLLAVVVTAFLVALLAEWRKKHLSKKTEEKVEGFVIQKTLAASALLFGGLEYALPFIQQNLEVLRNLKYVGGFVVAVYAAANFLYAMKFKSWFKAVQTYLEKRQAKLAEKAASDAQTEQSPQLVQPTRSVPDSPFEAEV